MNRVYLSLGANIEPAKNLPAAVRLLAEMTRLVAVSSVWKTAPVGLTNQPDFLNAAAIVESELTALAFKQQIINSIEQQLGRLRQGNKNAPRPIDIDIMLFNQQILKVGRRHIPDAEILERPFVAIPLAEIAPDYCHPEVGQTLADIAQRFSLDSQTMKFQPKISRLLKKIVQQTKQYFSINITIGNFTLP